MKNDLELTRLCAKAMGIEIVYEGAQFLWVTEELPDCPYDPLHDDAQAMALVKQFGMCIREELIQQNRVWRAMKPGIANSVLNKDLNRAICECVAKATADSVKIGATELLNALNARIKFLRDLMAYSRDLQRSVHQRDVELFEKCRDALVNGATDVSEM